MNDNVPSSPVAEPAAKDPKQLEQSAGSKSKIKGIITLLLFALLPFVALAILWRDRCVRTSVQSLVGPSGEMVLEQVKVDCGPSMRVASEVRLRKIKDGKTADQETVLILPSSDTLKIAWADNKTVTIELPDSQSQIVRYRNEWSGVHVGIIGEVISSAPKGLENL